MSVISLMSVTCAWSRIVPFVCRHDRTFDRIVLLISERFVFCMVGSFHDALCTSQHQYDDVLQPILLCMN